MKTKEISGSTLINQVVLAHPETLSVFHRHGMDSCCGGALPLETVAQVHEVDLGRLLSELQEAVARKAKSP